MVVAAPIVRLPQSTIDVNIKYKESHDALTTMNSLGVVVISVMVILVAHYLFLFKNTTRHYVSIFGYMIYLPQLVVSIVGLISVAIFMYFWSQRSGFDRLLPLVCAALLLGFILWMVSVNPDSGLDVWGSDEVGLDFGKAVAEPINNVWTSVLVLCIVSVAVSSIMGYLRMDKFRAYNAGFIALFISVGVMSYFMCSISSLALHSVSSLDEGWKRTAAYFAITIGFAITPFVFMRIGERFAEMFLVTEPNLPPTVSEISRRATDRTFTTIRIVILLTFMIPPLLIWRVRERQGPASYDINQQWKNNSALFFGGFAMLPVLGVIGYELFRIAPPLATMLASLVTAYVVFAIGLTTVKWSRGWAIGLVVLYITIIIAFSGGGLKTNTIGLSLLLAGMFLIIKYLGNLFVDFLDTDILEEGKTVSDTMRVAAWTGPVFIITILWIARSYTIGESYVTPLLFLFFCAFYILVFYFPDRDVAEREYMPGEGAEANSAIDFFVLFGVISITLSISVAVNTYVNILGSSISDGETPIAQTVFSFVAFVLVAYFAAYFYNYGQTDKAFLNFISDSQQKLRVPYEDFSKDVYKAADWARMGQDILKIEPDSCTKDDMCPGDMICYEQGRCTDRCYDDDDCNYMQVGAPGLLCDTGDGRCKDFVVIDAGEK